MVPTEIQKNIISCEGNVVVLASPGSGKTFVLSETIKRNLKNKNILPYQGIIAISYTREASKNLKNRTINEGIDTKNSFFGTIDSFCYTQIIKEFGNHVFGKNEKEIEIITKSDLIESNWIKEKSIDYEQITEEQISELTEIYKKGNVFVDSLEIMALHIIKTSKACKQYIKARFKAIYIDEYQDADKWTNALLFQLLTLGLRCVVVGDDKQSIFGFSHKSNKYLLRLKDNPEFKKFELNRNFRCSTPIINYSNRLLNIDCNIIKTDELGVFHINITGSETKISEYIDLKINKICRYFKVNKMSDIAILVKNQRTQAIINESLNTPHRYVESTDLDKDLNPFSNLYSMLLSYYFNTKLSIIEIIDNFIEYDYISEKNKKKIIKISKEIRSIAHSELESKIPILFTQISKIIINNSTEGRSMYLLKETLKDELLLNTYKPTNDNEIQLMTLHKSKGLEFDIVFHLNLNEWELPTRLPSNDYNNINYVNYAQDLNLHYVGITRAKKACYLISNTIRTNKESKPKNSKPSEFLSINQLKQFRENCTYESTQVSN